MKHFIAELFRELNAASVEYAILRNYDNLPSKPEDSEYFDLDLFVGQKTLLKYIQLVEKVSKKTGCYIIKRFDRSYVKHIRVVKFYNNYIASVQLDAHVYGQGWHGYYYITEDEILSDRKLYKEFYVVSDFHKTLFNWLDKLLWGGYVKEKYKDEIIDIFSTEKERLYLFLLQICPKRIAKDLVEIIESGDLEKTIDYRVLLRRCIVKRSLRCYPLKTLLWNIRFYYCEAKLRLLPPGLLLLADRDTEVSKDIFNSLELIVLGASLYKKFSCDSRAKWWVYYIRNVYPIVRKQGLVFLILDGKDTRFNYCQKIEVVEPMKGLMRKILSAYKKNTIIGRANVFVSGL